MKATDSSNIIQIGSQNLGEYVAFGDDFHRDDMLVYAFVIVDRNNILNVERKIDELKKFYCLPTELPLHCRVLFSGDARRKAGINHLSKEKLHSMIRRIVRIMNQTPIYLRYAYCDLSKQKDSLEQLGSELELHDKEHNPKMKIPFNPDPKGLLGLLAHMSLNTVPKDKRIPTIDKYETIVSADPTKVSFLGKNRRQAHYLCGGFSDVGAPVGKVYQFQPPAKKSDEASLLQLADIAAYICGQALMTNKYSYFFREQLKRINYWTNAEFQIGSEPEEIYERK